MEGKEGKESCSIHVVEHENARIKPVSYYPKEVLQICKDISGFFEGIKEVTLDAPADERDVSELIDEVPEALVELLMTHNGGIWINEYQTLSSDEILNFVEFTGKTGWVPFAKTEFDDFLVVGKDNHCGEVFECDTIESGSRKAPLGSLLGKSLASFLEDYRNKLLSHQLEYVDGCGIVECTTNSGGGDKGNTTRHK